MEFLTTNETIVSAEVETGNTDSSTQQIEEENVRLVPEMNATQNEISETETGNPPEILLGILQQLQGKEARKMADQLHDTIMKGTSWYNEHNPSTTHEGRQELQEQVGMDKEIDLDSETDSVRIESRQNSGNEQNQGTSSEEEQDNFPRSNTLSVQERARYRKQLRKQKLAQERKQKNQPTLTGKLLKLLVSLLVIGAEPYLECLSCAVQLGTLAVSALHVKKEHKDLLNRKMSSEQIEKVVKDILKKREKRTRQTNLLCPHYKCMYRSQSVIDYEIHQGLQHQNVLVSSKICPLCLTFLQKKLLKSHYKQRHAYRCCNITIDSAQESVKHVMIHHHNTFIKSVKECNRALLTKASLSRRKCTPWGNIYPTSIEGTAVKELTQSQIHKMAISTGSERTVQHTMMQVDKTHSHHEKINQTESYRNINAIILQEFLKKAAVKLDSKIDTCDENPDKPPFVDYPDNCIQCQDSDDHLTSMQFCFSRRLHMSQLGDFQGEKLPKKIFTQAKAILMGHTYFTITPPDLRGSILNLSVLDMEGKICNTGYRKGFPIQLSSRKGKAERPGLEDTYCSIVSSIVQLLPNEVSCPIFVEFGLERAQEQTLDNQYVQVVSFVNEIFHIGLMTKCQLIILGTFPGQYPFMPTSSYQQECEQINIVNRMLLSMCYNYAIPCYIT
ncbi:MAG: hypothetical protein FJ333_08205, partial [Sphingomonadales bacterium]|nr:hypothetical protein [Sphingomonadales bacterium]